MKKERKIKKFGFTLKIIDDVHDFCFRNVSLSRKNQQPVLGGHRFPEEKWQFFIGRETKTTHFTDENQRKQIRQGQPFDQ